MKIAIIGAGFSGLLAAYLLEKNGIDVTIYEKEEVLGGHCKTLISKDMFIDLGTVFTYSDAIKELFIELQIPYESRFTYRCFLNEKYEQVEHVTPPNVQLLLEEIKQLKNLIDTYKDSTHTINYDFIHQDLLVSFDVFLDKHGLKTIKEIYAPYLSAFGYGDIKETQAYYALKAFDLKTIESFIRGDKLLFIKKGTIELIKKLSHNITDIRYNIEVRSIENEDDHVKIVTTYDEDIYDKVLITTKLPKNVIKDSLYNEMMSKIETNPYMTCAYEINNRDLVTTYYKGNLGLKEKVQFYYPKKYEDRRVIVTYTYGKVNKQTVDAITEEIKESGIDIEHLITAKQWYIFPHIKSQHLTSAFYKDIANHQIHNKINLIGSLVCDPAMSKLYKSVKSHVERILQTQKNT